MITFIYTLSHPVTGEVRYVGKTVNPKQRKHNHSNIARDKGTYKRNWINSLKNQGLRPVFNIIDQVEDDWKFWERYWICQFKSWGFKLCNHTEGGDGLSMANSTSFKKGQIPPNKGIPLSQATKDKVSASLKGIVQSKETRLKRGKSMKLVQRSEEHIAALVKGGDATKFTIGSQAWNKGKPGYTTSKKGSTVPQSVRDQIANTLKGRTNTARSRPVKQIDMRTKEVIKEYPSASEVRRQTGINILNCISGRAKSAGGYLWH